MYPEQLMPETVEDLHLPSGLSVQVPKTQPVFRLWSGEFTEDTYGNKPLIDVDATPMFAELAILRQFQEDGWDGVWVDTFRKKYRTAWGEEGVVRLSGDKLQLLKAIHQKAGSVSGCFDVYCWKDDVVVFAESKRRSKDEIRQTQLVWLEAAMSTGLDASAFLIVEWLSAPSSWGSEALRRASTPRRIKSGTVGLGASSIDTVRSPTPHPQASEGYVIFYDAHDAGAHKKFIRWVERNQRGYVISRRSPSDAMIHQAYCGHFKHGDKSASLTRTMKVCSNDKGDLEGWARENLMARLKRCKSCM